MQAVVFLRLLHRKWQWDLNDKIEVLTTTEKYGESACLHSTVGVACWGKRKE